MAISVTAGSCRWTASGRRNVRTAMARSKAIGSGDGFELIDFAEIQIAGDHDANAFALVLVKGRGYIQGLFQNLGHCFLPAFAGVVKTDVVAAGLPLIGCPVAKVTHKGKQDGVAKAFPEVVVDMAV